MLVARCWLLVAGCLCLELWMRWGDRLNCKVFFHDKCFDGACSASLFTRFHRECVKTADSYSYQGLVHKAGPMFAEGDLGAGENAIVDFKYFASPKVTWWFDHHLSAFMTAADREDFVVRQALQAEAQAAG